MVESLGLERVVVVLVCVDRLNVGGNSMLVWHSGIVLVLCVEVEKG